jgi:hypothetical protein
MKMDQGPIILFIAAVALIRLPARFSSDLIFLQHAA